MEFHYTFQPMSERENKLNFQLDMNMDMNETDDFYQELRRQVLLLTADEEEDDHKQVQDNPHPRLLWSHFQDPAWLDNNSSTRNNGGQGTGVFIPDVVNSRKKNRPRRRNNGKRKIYKPVDVKN